MERGFDTVGLTSTITASEPYPSRHKMSWFKKFKKSRQSSKLPPSLGAPSNVGAVLLAVGAGLDSDVGSEGSLGDFGIDGGSLTVTKGVDNGGGPPFVLGESKDQHAHASGPSALTDGNNDCIAREYALLRDHGSDANLPDSTTRT